MQSFISRVIEDVLKQNTKPLKNVVFVLPSQRAGVFLKRELIQQLNTASFLPKIWSVEDFIEEIADLQQLDRIQLLFEFYTVYKDATPQKECDSFEQFTQWAPIVLNDFNDIDRQLINSEYLFAYLKDINRLKNWNPSTNLSNNYLKFFEKLNTYYINLNMHLTELQIGYQGMIYREAVQSIQHFINTHNDHHFVFVGFNALTKCEEHIFQELLAQNLASIYWDVDQSYLNRNNTVGSFIRTYREQWRYYEQNPFNWVEDYLNFEDKTIEIIAASKNVSQLKKVGELLHTLPFVDKTAIVLADESLLTLGLNSLPKRVDKINITMGLPLKNIPLKSLFTSLMRLYQNQEKFKVFPKNLFYHKDISSLLEDFNFRKLITDDVNIQEQLGVRNKMFLNTDDIFDILGKDVIAELEFLFHTESNSVGKIISNCKALCMLLKEKAEPMEREFVFRFFKVFQQLETLNETYNYMHDLQTFHSFFNTLIQNESLSFLGEPLEGLQLMGVLETRVIDFETVILTSANEGVLPNAKSEQSFIPYDVRKEVGLPTYQEKDAIFGYHFFRLLHRAKQIYLVYNSENDAFGSGEKSRFLTQIELKSKQIEEKVVAPILEISKPTLKEISKSNSLMSALRNLAVKGISPSAISNYINNPVDFYYSKVLGIKELETVEETMAHNTLGNVIHAVLEALYTPYLNAVLTKQDIASMRTKSEALIDTNFEKLYKNGTIESGKNRLIYEVTKRLIDTFLKQELQEIELGKSIEILGLEQKLSCELQVKTLEHPVKIHGIIDRIDRVDGTLRIVDYKSGMVANNALKISDFSLIKEDYKYSKALQVMLYAFMYSKTYPEVLHTGMEAGIYSLKNFKGGFIQMDFATKKGHRDHNISAARLEEFIRAFETVIQDLFNPELPFIENPDRSY